MTDRTTNAFTTKPQPTWTEEELRRMQQARSGQRGGTLQHERADPKAAQYIRRKK